MMRSKLSLGTSTTSLKPHGSCRARYANLSVANVKWPDSVVVGDYCNCMHMNVIGSCRPIIPGTVQSLDLRGPPHFNAMPTAHPHYAATPHPDFAVQWLTCSLAGWLQTDALRLRKEQPNTCVLCVLCSSDIGLVPLTSSQAGLVKCLEPTKRYSYID